MGTVVSIEVRDPGIDAAVVEEVVAYLHDIDARFSPYREDSEVCRLGRGELALDDVSPDLRRVLAMCEDLRVASDGHFDVRGHRGDGRLDPSGLVKGWSIDEAALILDAAGARDYWINAGGDILVRGEWEPGAAWRVGIRHPGESERLAAVLEVTDMAVATSGTYERGDHIRTRDGVAPKGLLSVTVVGPRLTWADAYATTAFAMGEAGIGWVAARPGYGVYAITTDERARWSDLVDDLLVR